MTPVVIDVGFTRVGRMERNLSIMLNKALHAVAMMSRIIFHRTWISWFTAQIILPHMDCAKVDYAVLYHYFNAMNVSDTLAAGCK